MKDEDILFSPTTIGSVGIKNRIVMAPMTRSRADDSGVPAPYTSIYYAQRASAGLIITEATQVDPVGKGYDKTPGIHSKEQVQAWKKVTDEVHNSGGKIFVQLWHVGRISNSVLLPENLEPLAPSAIKANAKIFAKGEFVSTSMPKEMTIADINAVVRQFSRASKLAMEAGFDGVEIHAANGYLLEQFIMDGTNKREDDYGGSAKNRVRLVTEVVDAVTEIWGVDRVGIRLSPTSIFNDMQDTNRLETFSELYRQLNAKNLAYLHVVEKFPDLPTSREDSIILNNLKKLWTSNYIANGGYTAETAKQVISQNAATAVAFGRPFISNPDLPYRIKNNLTITEPDPSTMYGGTEVGYIDYMNYTKSKS